MSRATTKTGKGARLVSAGRVKVRRELGVLRAALNLAFQDRIIPYAPVVPLPAVKKPKDRALSDLEFRWLMRAAASHLQRWLMIADDTGRRAAAITDLKWKKGDGGGWVDFKNNKIHFDDPLELRRDEENETVNKKRRGSVLMTNRLREAMLEWRDDGHTHVIHWRGKKAAEIDTAC